MICARALEEWSTVGVLRSFDVYMRSSHAEPDGETLQLCLAWNSALKVRDWYSHVRFHTVLVNALWLDTFMESWIVRILKRFFDAWLDTRTSLSVIRSAALPRLQCFHPSSRTLYSDTFIALLSRYEQYLMRVFCILIHKQRTNTRFRTFLTIANVINPQCAGIIKSKTQNSQFVYFKTTKIINYFYKVM